MEVVTVTAKTGLTPKKRKKQVRMSNVILTTLIVDQKLGDMPIQSNYIAIIMIQ